MQVVAFVNGKGGTGKTSCVFHLSATLAAMGHRILLVDNDPLACLTQGFWGRSMTARISASATIAAVYEPEGNAYDEELLAPTGIAGVTLVPGSLALVSWNSPKEATRLASQWGMRRFLEAVASDFDYCLIDCPPSLNFCSWAALLAAQHVVVPLQPDTFGSQRLGQIRDFYEAARLENPWLRRTGYLLTRVEARTIIHRTYEAAIRDQFGSLTFTSVLPRMAHFLEAVATMTPVLHYRPRSAASKAVERIADELLNRVMLDAALAA